MKIVNLDIDEPQILSSSDTKFLDYNNTKNLESENKTLKIGVAVVFVMFTVLIIYVNHKKKQERKMMINS